MKCKQKLCQRTNNICMSGYCNVCEDAIGKVKRKYEEIDKKKKLKKVELDMKLMIENA